MTISETIVGVILAGGLARRMGGGDKCLLPLVGKTLLQRVIDRAQPQVSTLLLNANGNSLRFARTRLPVVADKFPNNPGALAGIHAALNWMQSERPNAEWLISFASDTPFFPKTLVDELYKAALEQEALLAVAVSKSRVHPTFALWHVSLLGKIEHLLNTEATPRLQDWVNQQKLVQVDFSSETYDPFFNINSPQDLYAAEPLVNIIN